jgi:isoprenylcysteine carboxyl methyltransferase (ICMT) family protein YpbQ
MDRESNYQSLIIIMILLLFNCTVEAQVLNRQMFGSQGKSIVLKNGIFVSQSIGQQSIAGSFSNKSLIVQQGFQQSGKSNFSKILSFDVVSTTMYPNPIVDNVNFKFSSDIKGKIKIAILSVAGRLVYSGEQYVMGTVLTIESLGYLPSGVYVVYLSSLKYKYTGKIIKK